MKLNTRENRGREKKTVRVDEFAEILGVSYSTAWRLVNKGVVKAIPGLRVKLIPSSEVERFLSSAE